MLKFLVQQAASSTHERLILVTSPQCTPWCSWQYVNRSILAKIKDVGRKAASLTRAKTVFAKGLSDIRFARQLHRSLLRRASPKTQLVSIHEQPNSATMPRVLRHATLWDTDRVWPWAISPSSEHARVDGCSVGLSSADDDLMGKSWAFEVRGSQLLFDNLCRLRCGHAVKHARADGARTKATENYPRKLANVLVLGSLSGGGN